VPPSVIDQFTHEALSVLWADATRAHAPYFRRRAAFRTLSALAKSSLTSTPGARRGVEAAAAAPLRRRCRPPTRCCAIELPLFRMD